MLAGIVASLAQAGIEFKSQKLKRATEGRGGWLTITGSGDSPEPAVLAERLNGTRGVDKLMRVIVDGEAILAEGKPLEDQIQAGDLAELSAGSDSESDASFAAPEPPPTSDRAPEAQSAAPDIEGLPVLSESEVADKTSVGSEPDHEAATPDAPEKPILQSPPRHRAPAATATRNIQRRISLASRAWKAISPMRCRTRQSPSKRRKPPRTEGDDNPAQVGAVLRRRRRRRR